MSFADFFDTKFGKSSTIIFFAASMTFIGFHDLNKHIGKGYRNYVSLGQNRYLIVKELHGEVNVNKISQKRRVIRQESKKKRAEDWTYVKRFFRDLVP